MYIAPISFNKQENNTVFGTKRNDYVTKKFLERKKSKAKAAKNIAVAAGVMPAIFGVDELLKANGITYVRMRDNLINIASGYNGGFYSLRVNGEMSEQRQKEYVSQAFTINKSAVHGGLANYMDLVKDLKRQDIIQKGLKIHTYELNPNIPMDLKEMAATKLSKASKVKVSEKDLFYVEEEAFYYDKPSKTVYGINVNIQNYDKTSFVKKCQFITDSQKNAIGYKVKDWNVYHWDLTETEYMEQQAPSTKLPSVIEYANNKDLAEAFRFGNSPIQKNYRAKQAIPAIIEHLSKKLKIDNIDNTKLQLVKFYDKNNDVQTRIGYYDPTIGYSFVYSVDGQFLYQMEYHKDDNGNLTACARC